MTLRNRLRNLETAEPSRCVYVWRDHTETEGQAKARWKLQHPGEDLDRPGLQVILGGWEDPEPAT